MSDDWSSTLTRRTLLTAIPAAGGALLLACATTKDTCGEGDGSEDLASGGLPIQCDPPGPPDPAQEYAPWEPDPAVKADLFWADLQRKFYDGTRLSDSDPVMLAKAAAKSEALATARTKVDANYATWVHSRKCRKLTETCCRMAGKSAAGYARSRGHREITRDDYIDGVGDTKTALFGEPKGVPGAHKSMGVAC